MLLRFVLAACAARYGAISAFEASIASIVSTSGASDVSFSGVAVEPSIVAKLKVSYVIVINVKSEDAVALKTAIAAEISSAISTGTYATALAQAEASSAATATLGTIDVALSLTATAAAVFTLEAPPTREPTLKPTAKPTVSTPAPTPAPSAAPSKALFASSVVFTTSTTAEAFLGDAPLILLFKTAVASFVTAALATDVDVLGASNTASKLTISYTVSLSAAAETAASLQASVSARLATAFSSGAFQSSLIAAVALGTVDVASSLTANADATVTIEATSTPAPTENNQITSGALRPAAAVALASALGAAFCGLV
ncbi:hypothetical protein M885DRAFT_622154 [Pelagophyceae sp. CCMP2097]|nr:hypothetical protein M885DRAFT_622154 [Pelagophyceae sp. CCMP2097]